ncbi:hypothetical protein SAMN04488144_14127 [Methylobacterium sp. 190mf]|nr:hypothetical protein SAMN04488144_14127 [Methylobacterium sp. 190mf]
MICRSSFRPRPGWPLGMNGSVIALPLVRESEQVRHRHLQAANGRLESQTAKPYNTLARFTP